MTTIRDLRLPTPPSFQPPHKKKRSSDEFIFNDPVSDGQAINFETPTAPCQSPPPAALPSSSPSPSLSHSHASISGHALSYGQNVIGTRNVKNLMHHTYEKTRSVMELHQSDWIQWNASFAPHKVYRVASSCDGSVVAASTEAGFISLLNGINGNVFATRRVVPQSISQPVTWSDRENFYVELSFISLSQRHNATDSLVILTKQQQEEKDYSNIHQKSSVQRQNKSQVIIVTGIDGPKLTSKNASVMTDAAEKMSIDALNFEHIPGKANENQLNQSNKLELDVTNAGQQILFGRPLNENIGPVNTSPLFDKLKPKILDIKSLNGCHTDGITIRFLTVDTEDNSLHVHDYDLEEKQIHHVTTLSDSSSYGQFNPKGGIKVDTVNEHAFFILTYTRGRDITLCWYHVTTMELKCSYTLPPSVMTCDNNNTSGEIPILLALAPVQSCDDSSALAVVLAIKTSFMTVFIVVQVVVSLGRPSLVTDAQGCHENTSLKEESGNDNDGIINNGISSSSIKLSMPHVVYTIPHKSSISSATVVETMDMVSLNHHSYSFRYIIFNSTCSYECREFITSTESPPVGPFRLLLAKAQFDKADELLSSHCDNITLSDDLTTLHGSEVALWQLRHILHSPSRVTEDGEQNIKQDFSNAHDGLSPQLIAQAKQCVRRLATGAVSGGDIGVFFLREASASVRSWPQEKQQGQRKPRVNEFRMALAAIQSSISNVLSSVPKRHVLSLQDEINSLDKKMQCVQLLREALSSSSANSRDFILSPPLANASCPYELYKILLSQGALTTAERVRQLQCELKHVCSSSVISYEKMASAVTSLPLLSMDPQSFCPWLRNVVIPGLKTLYHPILAEIRMWGCRMADAYDDDESDDKPIKGGTDGLDAAIVLLEAICEATARLSTCAYSSFASSSPFVDDLYSRNESAPMAVPLAAADTAEMNNAIDDSTLTFDSTSTTAALPSYHNSNGTPRSNSSRGADSVQSSFSRPANPSVLQFDTYRGDVVNSTTTTSPRRKKSKRDSDNNSTHYSFMNKSYDSYSPANMSFKTSTSAFSPSSTSAATSSFNYDCETKLFDATVLKKARHLSTGGLLTSLPLRHYHSQGGATNVARLLVKQILCRHEVTFCKEKIQTLEEFCTLANVNFDSVIEQHISHQLCLKTRPCDNDNDAASNPQKNLEEAAFLCHYCTDSTMKCDMTLSILRAGLLILDDDNCSTNTCYKFLKTLSREALTSWSINDPQLQAELKETERLLIINDIIRRYCGNGAQDYFRIMDPTHAYNLLQHVCSHVVFHEEQEIVVNDAMELCDAFVNLRRIDACVLLVELVILAPSSSSSSENGKGDEHECAKLLKRLFAIEKDEHSYGSGSLATDTATRAIIFCQQVLSDCSEYLHSSAANCAQEHQNSTVATLSHRRNAKAAASAAYSMLGVLIEHRSTTSSALSSRGGVYSSSATPGMFSRMGTKNWGTLQGEFQRIVALHKDFDIFMDLSELRGKRKRQKSREEAAAQLLIPAIEILCKRKNNTPGDNPRTSTTLNDDPQIKLRDIIAKAKRATCLLFGAKYSTSAWCNVVELAAHSHLSNSSHHNKRPMTPADDSACFELLAMTGTLDDIGCKKEKETSTTLASVAKSFLEMALKKSYDAAELSLSVESWSTTTIKSETSCNTIPHAMRCVIRASFLLQEHVLINCPDKELDHIASLSFESEIISQILVRADGGTGETIDAFKRDLQKQARLRREPFFFNDTHDTDNRGLVLRGMILPPVPKLHPSWYISDGLLLPPQEALMYSMAHYEEYINTTSHLQQSHNETAPSKQKLSQLLTGDIISFLSSRGAHSAALRTLVSSAVTNLALKCPDERTNISLTKFPLDVLDVTFTCLSERSLGGSGNGITSGTVDSQLAVAHLLCLPVKVAFKVYKSALPSAISRRDFSRVITLAEIGACAGDWGKIIKRSNSIGWGKQQVFVTQCQHLASNARWWKILQHYGAAFDPRHFGEELGSKTSQSKSQEYASSIIPSLFIATSKKLNNLDGILNLARRFAHAFQVNENLAPQKFLEFLLSCPQIEKSTREVRNDNSVVLSETLQTSHRECIVTADIRRNIERCEMAAKSALLLLPSPMARSAVLRRCVISLEEAKGSRKDYERHMLALSLYHYELSKVTLEKRENNTSDYVVFCNELKRIERRQDVLVLLTSYFAGETHTRPDYPPLFQPFPVPFGSKKPPRKLCGVIRTSNKKAASDLFDPLYSLKDILVEESAISALAPLCHSLGLPTGYVHARSLFERFQKFKTSGSQLPSFETSVLPVLDRMHAESDAALLAEWCSMQYDKGSLERLKCLDHALNFAMTASSKAEDIRQNNTQKNDGELANKEKKALKMVKRIVAARSDLGDRINVISILRQLHNKYSACSKVKLVLSNIVSEIEQMDSKFTDPDKFVEKLLTESSMMAAVASLDGTSGFTIDHFRQVAALVHEACNSLAGKYSHVHVGECARKLARRWMLHGDNITDASKPTFNKNSLAHAVSSSKNPEKGTKQTHVRNLSTSFSGVATDDDATGFVMDLNAIGEGKEVWSDDIASGEAEGEKVDVVTVVEEPSALKAMGSAREQFEYSNARAALRIAFVISFANDYFPHIENEDFEKENYVPRDRLLSFTSKSEMSTGSSQKRKRDMHRRKDLVMEYARELLNIVFAKLGTKTWKHEKIDTCENTGLSQNFDKSSVSKHELYSKKRLFLNKPDAIKNGTTFTFAMRYRALRTASILCPQKALEIISQEEGFYENSTLIKCCYGSFVSMEIEALGLPLPHSCLVQLSNMHFSSYARALWRDHGHNECKVFRGRFLRLLLELCMKDEKISDIPLVNTILKEMLKLDIPRTLLFACELIVGLDKRAFIAFVAFENEDGDNVLTMAVTKTSRLILGELKQVISDMSHEFDMTECISVIRRLGCVVANVGETVIGKEQLIRFAQLLCQLSKSCIAHKRELSLIFMDVVLELSAQTEEDVRSKLLMTLVGEDGGLEVILNRFRFTNDFKSDNQVQEPDSTSLMTQIEDSMRSDTITILKKAGKFDEFVKMVRRNDCSQYRSFRNIV